MSVVAVIMDPVEVEKILLIDFGDEPSPRGGSLALLDLLLEKNFKAYPRYVRDQCLLAQKGFSESTNQAVLEHAVDFCLSNETLSMKDLLDTYRYYMSWIDEDEAADEEQDFESPRLNGGRMGEPIAVAQRGLDEYTTLLSSSAGDRR